MPLSLTEDVVTQRAEEASKVKQPPVVNSDSAKASVLTHCGGVGGGGGSSGLGSTTSSVRDTTISWIGVASSWMRTRTTCGPVVVNVVVSVRSSTASSKAPSSSESQA